MYLWQPGAGLAGNPGGESKVPNNSGHPPPLPLHQDVLGREVSVEETLTIVVR